MGGGWEGSDTVKDKFVDVKVSTEGWLAAVTSKGGVYTWDVANDWALGKQPAKAMSNVTCMDIVRF